MISVKSGTTIKAISLLDATETRSLPFREIQDDMQNLWLKLWLKRDLLERKLFAKYGKMWAFARVISRYYPPMTPYSIEGTPLNAGVILRSNQLWGPRRWEYPWAVLNSGIKPLDNVLDIGSGWSLFPAYLSHLGANVTATDTLPLAVDVLGPTIAGILKARTQYKQLDVLAMNQHEVYDTIFCISVLEHLEEEVINGVIVNEHRQQLERKAISNLIQALKPGGRLVITLDYDDVGKWPRSFDAEYVHDLILYLGDYPDALLRGMAKEDLHFTPEARMNLRKMPWQSFPFDGGPEAGVLGMVIEKHE